jgi:ribonuclease Z
VHDATFLQEEAERARETGHATAMQAAQVALQAGVRRLVLTHISARYAEVPHLLEAEARRVFDDTRVGHDGMVVEVPFPDHVDARGGGRPAASSAGEVPT